MYYYGGTLSSGSADPLWGAKQLRSLLGTGWGPRGDSGSARGRVRATQPAIFFCFPQHFYTPERRGGPKPGPPFLFCRKPACNLQRWRAGIFL